MLLTSDLDFTGRRVLITGAANGFGAAMAEAFASHGASLVLADIEQEALLARARSLHGQVTCHVFDQGDPAAVTRLADVVGNIDVLVNNAGILLVRPILDSGIGEIRRLIEVDFIGLVLLTQQIGRRMVERRRGVVINIGSQTAFCGGEGRGVYAAAKAAVSQFTRAAAVEWGPYGVRVVCIAPGRSVTRMTEGVRSGGSTDRGLARVPLGRWGQPEDVAKLALFLASGGASYITGETIVADGGYVIG